MNSRVHPKYKTKYRVRNWATYDRALVRRGDVTVWLSSDAIAAWEPASDGRRGGQLKYSDLAIETTLTLRLVFNLPLRQAEGFLQSLFGMMGVDLSAPDHTTLSRRGQSLDLRLSRTHTGEAIHLIVDSTGLSIVGEGEWAAAKHGGKGKRGWKKLHLGVDGAGVIVAQVLTDGSVDDAKTGLGLIDAVEGSVTSLTADAAYDTIAIYEAAEERSAKVVVPPVRSATDSKRGRRSVARDSTIRRVRKVGRRQWKRESGYHRQGTVENAFFRYKSIIGSRLKARHPSGQKTEALLACNVLNRMFDPGRPNSAAIGP
jgi:IS5 family transposase